MGHVRCHQAASREAPLPFSVELRVSFVFSVLKTGGETAPAESGPHRHQPSCRSLHRNLIR